MSNLRLPRHLEIAKTFTEDEYARSMWQSKIVMTTAIVAGVAVGIPLVVVYGFLIGFFAAGAIAVLIERLLHRVFKDAYKAKTERMRRYKELKEFRERATTQSENQNESS